MSDSAHSRSWTYSQVVLYCSQEEAQHMGLGTRTLLDTYVMSHPPCADPNS